MTANVRRDVARLRRLQRLQQLVVDLGRADFERRHPDLRLPSVVALVHAPPQPGGDGAGGLVELLAGIPADAAGLDVAALVVADGAGDEVIGAARRAGAPTFALPAEVGQGVSLRVGYDLCVRSGTTYVVILDARDGSPTELGALLRPLVDDVADIVTGSRLLGRAPTGDPWVRAGLAATARLMNLVNGTKLTDDAGGVRALRTVTLSDVIGRLHDDDHVTTELLATAARRGWRIVEHPAALPERSPAVPAAEAVDALGRASVILRTWWRQR